MFQPPIQFNGVTGDMRGATPFHGLNSGNTRRAMAQ
jgi:hypothetical protein